MLSINFGAIEGHELREGWGLLPDPMNRCRAQKWWKSIRKENCWFPSYDDDAFWPTTVPGAFNRLHDKLAYYEGTVVYLNHFSATKPDVSSRVFLHFEGVADHASVFLNGVFLGEHDGGYIPFTFDVTSMIAEENRLMVLVDNIRSADDVPGTIHDWWHDGGIIRPVTLHTRPRQYIRDVRVTTELEDGAVRVACKVMIDGVCRDQKHRVELRLIDPQTERVVVSADVMARASSWASTTIELAENEVRLWSPQAPNLYRIEARLADDVWHDQTGLREIRTEGKSILLNGKPVILRGAAAWTEDPDCGLFSLMEQQAEKTVSLLKELNCNFARAGHRPNSMAFVRACDRAGILLWVEVPAYWIPTMQKPSQSRRALKMLSSSIRACGNNPSVIIWSIGNECLYRNRTMEQSNLAYFVEAADLVHAEDPSRLVTYTGGVEGTGDDDKMDEVCPVEIVEKLDIVSINSYSGIDDGAEPGKPDTFPEQIEKTRYVSSWGKPVIHAEAGIDAVRGNTSFDFGEARQVAYHTKLQRYFREGAEEGSLQGLCVFVLNDFSTPIKLGRYQRGFNRKGLVDERLQPKAVFSVVRDGYRAVADKQNA